MKETSHSVGHQYRYHHPLCCTPASIEAARLISAHGNDVWLVHISGTKRSIDDLFFLSNRKGNAMTNQNNQGQQNQQGNKPGQGGQQGQDKPGQQTQKPGQGGQQGGQGGQQGGQGPNKP
jgi:hypothetical protein